MTKYNNKIINTKIINKIVGILIFFFFTTLNASASSLIPSLTSPQPQPTTAEILNQIFYDNHDNSAKRKDVKLNRPSVTILACSDSRIHMESAITNPSNPIDNAFIIRNIANQFSPNKGSIDYGIQKLKTPFLIIVGHSECGSVKAAMHGAKTNFKNINQEISTLNITTKTLKGAVVENINNQVNAALKEYKDKIKSGELTVIGLLYDVGNSFGHGKDKIVLVNVNGESDPTKLKNEYNSFYFLNSHQNTNKAMKAPSSKTQNKTINKTKK